MNSLGNEDWTADETGGSNNSPEYLRIVRNVVNEMRECRHMFSATAEHRREAGRLIAYASGLDLGETGSPSFKNYAEIITELLDQDWYNLSLGNYEGTARLLVSHLAHKYGVEPRPQP